MNYNNIDGMAQIMRCAPHFHRSRSMTNLFRAVIGLLLATSMCLAHADPVNSSASGFAGGNVTVKLVDDNPIGFFGGSFNVTFDTNILTYISGAAGTLLPAPFSVIVDDTNAGTGALVVSLSILDAVTDPGADSSLMALLFNIDSAAAVGSTATVSFSPFDFSDDGSGVFDYDFRPVNATVTVLGQPGNRIPLPGTLPLMALAVAALAWSRRRIH